MKLSNSDVAAIQKSTAQAVRATLTRYGVEHSVGDDLYNDMIQIGILKVVERFDPSRGIAAGTFAYACVRNAIIDLLRTRNNGAHVAYDGDDSADGENDFALADLLPSTGNPEQILLRKEKMQRASDAFDSLSPEAQQLILDHADAPHGAIKAMTGGDPKAAAKLSKQLWTARNELRETFDEMDG